MHPQNMETEEKRLEDLVFQQGSSTNHSSHLGLVGFVPPGDAYEAPPAGWLGQVKEEGQRPGDPKDILNETVPEAPPKRFLAASPLTSFDYVCPCPIMFHPITTLWWVGWCRNMDLFCLWGHVGQKAGQLVLWPASF